MADASGKPQASEFDLDVPISAKPSSRKGKFVEGSLAHALRKLSRAPIGASKFFPGKSPKAVAPRAHRSVGSRWYTTRTVTENGVKGVRVWKIAEPTDG